MTAQGQEAAARPLAPPPPSSQSHAAATAAGRSAAVTCACTSQNTSSPSRGACDSATLGSTCSRALWPTRTPAAPGKLRVDCSSYTESNATAGTLRDCAAPNSSGSARQIVQSAPSGLFEKTACLKVHPSAKQQRISGWQERRAVANPRSDAHRMPPVYIGRGALKKQCT